MAFSGLCQDFGGYLNTLNTSSLLPTNWNKRRLKISGTRMPSSPLSLYPQLFPTVHLRQRTSVVRCQLLTTFLRLQNHVSHISALLDGQLMDVHTGSDPCIRFHSFLSGRPLEVSAVPEISAVPQNSDYQGDKTHQETTHFAK